MKTYLFKSPVFDWRILLLSLFSFISLIFSQAQVAVTFEYSGSPQNWVVPPGVFSVDLELYGASGGSASTVTMGGPGGFAQGTLDVTPGTLLYLYVGGEGQVNTGEPIDGGGWNGGGDALGSPSFIRGGGGGASDVRVGGSSLHDRVIVAAGGGGTGGDGLPGGAGGGLNGGPGYHNPSIGGEGGSINQGGLTSTNSDGQSGSFGQGGSATNIVLLAGGGAGWFGGGSGRAGGGGSSYIGGVRDGSTASTPRRGNGQIILSYVLPENNDFCETPSPINCNEVITADTRMATPDPNTCTDHTDGGGGLWYSFIGTGEEVTVTTDFEATDFDTRLSVYTALCDELICIGENDNISVNNSNSQISFFAAEGGIYRILVDGPQSAEGNFQLAVICGNPCEQARPLSCFESLTGNTSDALPFDVPQCNGAANGRGDWFTFTGTGDCIILNLCTSSEGQGTEFPAQISVFTGDCDNLQCTGYYEEFCDLDGTPRGKVYLPSIQGERYYVLVHGLDGAVGNYRIFSACSDQSLEVDCLEDVYLECGEEVPLAATNAAEFKAQGGDIRNGACIPHNTDTYTITSEDDFTSCQGNAGVYLRRIYTITNDYSGETTTCIQQFYCPDIDPLSVSCPNDFSVDCDEDIPGPVTNLAEFEAIGGEITGIGSCDANDLQFGFEFETAGDLCSGITVHYFTEIKNAISGEIDMCYYNISKPPAQTPTVTIEPISAVECPDDLTEQIIQDATEVSWNNPNCEIDYELTISRGDIYPIGDCGLMVAAQAALVDECDRSVFIVRLVDVCNDGPQITCPPVSIVTCREDILVNEEAVEVIPACGESYDLEAGPIELISGIDGCGGALYSILYTVINDYGQTASCEQFFELTNAPLVADPQHPDLIGLPDQSSLPIVCTGDEQVFPEFTVNDVDFNSDCGAEVDVTLIFEDLGAASCQLNGYIHRYQYRWTAIDECGRTLTYTVFLELVDNTPPVLHQVPDDITISCFDPIPTSASVTATDECECACTEIEYQEDVLDNGDCSDSYQLRRRWTATDLCGNTSTAEQIITIVDDQVPEITFAIAPEVTQGSTLSYQCGNGDYVYWLYELDERSIHITDPCSSEWDVEFALNPRISMNCAGDGFLQQFEPYWQVTDPCGNTSTLSFTIEIHDEEAPAFLASQVYYLCPGNEEIGTIEVDDCSRTELSFHEEAHPECEGLSILYYEATDECGTQNVFAQTIVDLQDNPNLIQLAEGIDEPQPIYPCSSQSDQLTSYDATSVSPTMSCLDDLEIGFTEQILPNSCDQNGPLLQLLWTATTPCGYIDSLEYIVELIDNDAPTFYGVEEEIILSCGKELPTVEVYDDCSTPILQMAYDTLVGTCPQDYRVVRTITATDMCGNSESVTQLIHFIDQEAPVFEVAPNVCADEATEEIWAFDACQDNWINADLIHESYLNSCGDLVLIERIWMATDACGNSQEFRQVIYPDDYQLDIFFANPEDSNTLANLPSTLSLANPNHMAILERLEASTVQARTPCGEIIEGEFMIEIEYTDNCEDGIAEIRTYRWFFLDICGKRTEYVHHFAIDYSQDLMIEIEQNTDVFCSTEIPDLEIFNYQNHFNYEVTESDLRNENGDGLVIREVSATDPCGNFGTATQTIYCYNTTDLSCLIEGEVNPICQSRDNEYYVSIAGGTAPYTIYWQVNGQDCYIQSVNGETAQIKFGFGLAQIIVEVIDANGCQTSCELEVNCTGGTHNRPTTAEYQISSEPDLQDDKVFQIYPNPANQLLFIKSPEGEVTAIEVYLRDQLGRLVLEENSHQQTTALNLEKLPAGLYYLEVRTGSKSMTSPIVKITH